MSHLAALNATSDSEYLAFGILKQFIAPSFPHGFATIFGLHEQTYLPFPTSIPLGPQHTVLPAPRSTTMALLESIRHADRDSYAHATNHAAHVYNFAHIAGFTAQETTDAYFAALLHDIGKLYFMELIKVKRKLTPHEKNEVNRHSILSYLILSSCGYSDTVRYSGLFHHFNKDRKWGYPQINQQLTIDIIEMASEYGLPVPKESSANFSHISERQWMIINAVTLLDSLDAAIDPNREYKTALKLSDVLGDFETNAINWSTLFASELKKPFEQYVKWLEKKLAS
jgi:hypothetical protein